jgi:hypothetical protein
VLPYAFAAVVMYLGRQAPAAARRGLGQRQKRLLVSLGILSVLCCYHHGMIYPRHNFLGGFGPIVFDYEEKYRIRYENMVEVIRHIPPDASVSASEAIVAHVAGRPQVSTVRYPVIGKGMASDYLAVFTHDQDEHIGEILRDATYEVVTRKGDVILYRLVSQDPPAEPPKWPVDGRRKAKPSRARRLDKLRKLRKKR